METEQVQKNIQQFLENKVNEADAEGLVLGLSGGIDSATCLKLAVNALGKERITALIMPGEPSRETNTDDARELAEGLGVETIEIDIGDTVDSFQQDLPLQTGKEGLGNIRARTRMVYTYAVANEKNLLVLGTGNRTEYLLGYFTKYGDGATDIAPLLDLYKTEVKKLAEHIDLDRKFIEKKPTAGLWEGQTDEDEIGTD
jgi:NAD+ synthase